MAKSSEERSLLLERAFDQYHSGMVFFAMQYLGDRGDSEDVVSELYVRVWEMETLDFENDRALKAYLFRSVRNACLNLLGRSTAPMSPLELIRDQVCEERHVAFDQQALDAVMAEIEKLPAQTRRVFTKVFLEGKKYQQAADELGISVNTVKMLLKNGVKHIRKRFRDKADMLLAIFPFLPL